MNDSARHSFRVFGVGWSAALLALGCGRSVIDDSVDTPVTSCSVGTPCAGTKAGSTASNPVGVDFPPLTCADNPLLEGCPLPTLPASNPQALPPQAPTATPDEAPAPGSLARAAAVNVLIANCGLCHGPQLTPELADAGINYIGDLDELVVQGYIVPLNSAGSPIVQLMQTGEMPPRNSALPRVTASDIAAVASYIDDPRFWPGF